MMKKNKRKEKICLFFASDYHFEMISLPYINENLKKNKNVKSIIHVGSRKDKIKNPNCKINDIDLFIIVEKQNENQIRKVKKINNIEFDFNYISIDGSYQFIENKTYFFLKIKDGNIIYDENNIGKEILSLCEKKYDEGPDKLSFENKKFKVDELISEISRLKKKEDYEKFEYECLIYMYLHKIIKTYYLINDIWLPKDKKLIKSLKEQDIKLYELVINVKNENKYEKILEVIKYALVI